MSQPRVISFHYTLKDGQGNTLDSSRGHSPLAFLEGQGQIIPGLESEVSKMLVGTSKNIKVVAKEAYGEQNPELIFDVPNTQFPENGKNVKVGDQFRGESPDGRHSPVLRVVKVSDTHVTLDENHPLAGQDLFFDVEVTEVRPATADEVAHGHAHGPDGHHH